MTKQSTTGIAPAGVNEVRRVQCKKSEYHGFHPSNEDCPYCEPNLTSTYVPYDDDYMKEYYANLYKQIKGAP